ncbi:MAG: hypothetical protein K9K88_04980 [Desulfobacterales bacterium]|nr:hypothetical protein [Desulfobacterales bacterium]
MALSYQLIDDILVINAGGRWDFPEMKSTQHAAVGTLGDRSVRGVLVDHWGSKSTGLYEDYEDMARFRRSLTNQLGTRLAVVVSDNLHFGLARMSSGIHYLHGIDMQPFWDMDGAWDWIRREGGVNAGDLKI